LVADKTKEDGNNQKILADINQSLTVFTIHNAFKGRRGRTSFEIFPFRVADLNINLLRVAIIN
jgi:hypothetical protein